MHEAGIGGATDVGIAEGPLAIAGKSTTAGICIFLFLAGYSNFFGIERKVQK